MRTVLLVFAIAVGGAGGGWLALRMLDRGGGEPAPPAAPAPPITPPPAATEPPAERDPGFTHPLQEAVLPEGESFYLHHLRPHGGIEIDEMTPLLISPKATEVIPPDCPERLALVRGESHQDHVVPYLVGIGPWRLPVAEGAPHLVRNAVARLAHKWDTVNALARGPVAEPPLRVLVKHYPRPDLPGRCVTIHVAFYNVLDAYFDLDEFHRRVEAAGQDDLEIRGLIFDLRRTYQLQDGAPRVVEALLEVSGPILATPPRRHVVTLLPESERGGLFLDPDFASHFMPYGGGERHGIAWFDRAYGLGEAKPWARAYRIRRSSFEAPPEVETEPVSAALAAEVRRIASRA